MPRKTEILSLLVWGGALIAALSLTPAPRAADDGNSALPRREDVTYRQPGAGSLPRATLSWSTKFDNDSSFAGLDSVTPSVWISGAVYSGITWYWKEGGLPGDIFFAGFSSNLDTVVYDPPMRWLPLDPAGTGNWETTSTNNKGETWTFRLQYDGTDTVAVGNPVVPDSIVCWRVLLEQEGPATGSAQADDPVWDGMGVPRQGEIATKAFNDTLWYEVNALPRRRMRSTNQFPQNELLYEDHITRETPVSSEETGVGGLKARYRR